MKIKRFVSALVAVAITTAMSVTVFAASGINADEQRIINALNAPITNAAGKTATIPANYVADATSYFNRDGVDVTAAQADEIIAKIDEARALVAATDATSADDLPVGVVNEVTALAESAAKVIGVTISINTADRTFTFYGPNGDPISDSNNTVKDSGIGFASTGIVLVALITALGGVALFTRKQRLAAAA